MENVFIKVYHSSVLIIIMYTTITGTKKYYVRHGFCLNTSKDTLVANKPDSNIFLTPNLRHLSTMHFMLLKIFSVFDWLLSFKISFIQV